MCYNKNTIKQGGNNMSKENYMFTLTNDQKETICRHFGVDTNEVEDWEIAELLNKIIDSLVPMK